SAAPRRRTRRTAQLHSSPTLPAARTTTLLLAAALLAPAWLAAGDWPGWRGPDRTGVSAETGLLQAWPEGGPPLVWKATGLGGGYATPAVAGGRLFVFGSHGHEDQLMACDLRDGRRLWSTRVG